MYDHINFASFNATDSHFLHKEVAIWHVISQHNEKALQVQSYIL
jgi:hypothetical protein